MQLRGEESQQAAFEARTMQNDCKPPYLAGVATDLGDGAGSSLRGGANDSHDSNKTMPTEVHANLPARTERPFLTVTGAWSEN